MIDVKEGFVPRKEKVYPLSREEIEEVREFIWEQLRKGYIQPSKLLQTALVFFVGKKNGKKRIVQDYRLSGAVHTRVEVYRMDLEMSRLVK